MAVEVVTGPPFGGKARYVRSEIARREADGELGLFVADWTALYAALVWGAQSQFRDDEVSDTGAPRAAGAVFDAAVAVMLARELSGYITTQSPDRAVVLADRFDARLVEVDAPPDVVASRAELHMRSLGRTVTRAALSKSRPRCRKAGAAYFNQQERLVGRAHVARQRGRGYAVDPEPKKPFDRELFMRGLTAKGREAVAQLKELGNAEPSPAQVLEFLLRNRVDA
ncbi:MAG: hypothetical protein OXG04_24155 [Acidobacteria bacterium]|nr:hypothetical protein [Acidobacteriota bacterium]